jgi:hypothetical protein
METQTLKTHRDIRHRRYPRGPDGINDIMCCSSPMPYNLVQGCVKVPRTGLFFSTAKT